MHGDRSNKCFNPRTREGATTTAERYTYAATCFNPRTREGATVGASATVRSQSVSIHAPVKVRLPRLKDITVCFCFNPRTREGATPEVDNKGKPTKRFNPRTREGATITSL